MVLHRIPLYFNRSCSFWKLMGSGRNGSFDLRPDLQQWALLAVWDSKDDFRHFYRYSFVSKWWRKFTVQSWTILCTPLSSHGRWDGRDPFDDGMPDEPYAGPIAVLTRATIRVSRLKEFWSAVAPVAGMMASAKGYIASFGIGEAPVFRQATFSLWRSAEDIRTFAYRSPEHSEVIRKTRERNWYAEELFARFKPIESFGSIGGRDPLKDNLTN